MPNHGHLVLVPDRIDGLRAALSEVHRAYAGHIHAREQRPGHFWQGCFGCVAMDEPHLLAALRYVAFNPVRAGLVARPKAWRWSSVHALLDPARGDGITDTTPRARAHSRFRGAAIFRRGCPPFRRAAALRKDRTPDRRQRLSRSRRSHSRARSQTGKAGAEAERKLSALSP